MPKFNLKQKLLLFFVLLPTTSLLILVNAIWFNASKQDIIRTVSLQVGETANHAVDAVSNYLTTKVLSLIIHSQTEAMFTQNQPNIVKEFQNFLLQDKDIQLLTLLDANGKELIKVGRDKVYSQQELKDQKNTSAYKVTTFVGGDQYISQLYTDATGRKTLDIAIPIVQSESAQSLEKLTTSSVGTYRQPQQLRGILIETIYPDTLWEQIQSIHSGQNGYVFLINDKGRVLFHPRQNQLAKNDLQTLPVVDRFLTSFHSTVDTMNVDQFDNEFGKKAIMTSRIIPLTNWGIVAEVPLSDTLTATNQIAIFAIILFLLTLSFVVAVSLWMANRIVNPIKLLAIGSKRIGSGDFNYRIQIQTGDEIESLGNAFNVMALNLQELFKTLHKSQLAISTERNKLAVIIASIADGLLAVDTAKRIVLCNKEAARLLGYREDELIGKSLDAVMRVYDGDGKEIPYTEYAPEIIANKEGTVYQKEECKLIGKDNTTSFVNLLSGQIKEARSSNIGCIITLHDIAKEREFEKMKLDFVSMTAHELRTPLTAIRGYLSVVQDEVRSMLNDEQKLFFERIQISTDQLLALIENILSVSGIERNSLSVTPSPIDWLPLVEQVFSDLKDRAKEQQLSYTLTKPEEPLPQVMADAVRVREVLANLIANALTYTKQGGQVSVSVEKRDGMIVTHVSDTGVGIPKDALPHLFTKFYRVKGPLVSGAKGTGLGLYIAKSIIDQHHGQIWVVTEVGKGSTFSFSLPLADLQNLPTSDTSALPASH